MNNKIRHGLAALALSQFCLPVAFAQSTNAGAATSNATPPERIAIHLA